MRAEGHNRIDAPKFQDAESIDAEHVREAREWAVHKKMEGAKMMDGLRARRNPRPARPKTAHHSQREIQATQLRISLAKRKK